MTLTRAELHGGAIELAPSADFDILMGSGRRLQVINTTTSGFTGTLPPVNDISVPMGVNVLWIVNVGADAFTIEDTEATFSTSIANLEAGMLMTIRNLAGTKVFFMQKTLVRT
jgi:hypothetical protein